MLRTLVKDYPAIHTGVGIVGNLLFFAGSILFFERLLSTALAAPDGARPRLVDACRARVTCTDSPLSRLAASPTLHDHTFSKAERTCRS